MFQRDPGQLYLFKDLCPECELKRTAQAQPGEIMKCDGLFREPKHTFWTRLKAWASRYAAYLDALLLRLL